MPFVTLSTLVYVSELADSASTDAVAAIARQARVRNAADGVTGLLAFDGHSFAQLVEGSADRIADLWQRVRRDRRHDRIELLFQDAADVARRFPSWGLGYLLLEDDGSGIASLRGSHGDAAVRMFLALARDLDAEVGEALPR